MTSDNEGGDVVAADSRHERRLQENGMAKVFMMLFSQVDRQHVKLQTSSIKNEAFDWIINSEGMKM